jgi:hypothetical protein
VRGGRDRKKKVASEPEALVAWFNDTGIEFTRIGLEAGPLSQSLHAWLTAAGLSAILIETRHVKAALKAMTVRTDRNDARGMAQRCAWDGSVGARQNGAGARDPGAADWTEVAARQVAGRRAWHSRPAARLWAESGASQQGPV